MTLTAPGCCRLAIIVFFSLASMAQTFAVADNYAFPFPQKTLPTLQRTDQLEQPGYSDHPFSENSDHSQIGLVFPTGQDFDGMLAPSRPAAPIDPATAPSRYKISAVISYNYGVSLYKEGKVFQALKEWKSALRIQPTFPEGQYALSLLSHLHGKEGDAISYAINARLHKPDWAAAAYHMGVLHYEAGQFAVAGQDFQVALNLEPNDPLTMNGLGLSKIREGHFPEAVQALTMAMARNPNSPCIYHNLGLTFFAHQQWEQARRQFEETLRLDPTLDRTHHWLGMTYAAMGQWTQAISSWQRTITLDSHHPQIHLVYYNLGTAYWMTGNPIDAQQAYQMALRNNLIWPQAHYQLGVIDMALSQWDKASQHFLTSLQLAPDWEQPYFNLGLVRYNQGLLRDALKAFQQAVALQPDFTDAQYHLGLTLRILRHDPRAFRALEQAAQAGHIAAQEMLAGMYANGRGTTRNLIQAMRWWHRASRGPDGDQAADHARAQLSRLRQQYFLHRENRAYAQELHDGFHAIQSDIWHDHSRVSLDRIDAYQGESIGMSLALRGRILQAIPLLVSEAYSLHFEAHSYLEILIQEGFLKNTPTQLAHVMKYFEQTASEGSSNSCRFLTLLYSPSEENRQHLQQAHFQPPSCRSSLP
ncbi:MAG: tetratricopeptide repeat protein [Nitrospirota bacterium]|nr:tetratricopeptide repeat protein [Nitrospirota bacterium]